MSIRLLVLNDMTIGHDLIGHDLMSQLGIILDFA